MSNKIRISHTRNMVSFLYQKFEFLLNPRSTRLLVFPYEMSRVDYVRQLRDAEIQALIDRKDLWILEHPKILHDNDCFQV